MNTEKLLMQILCEQVCLEEQTLCLEQADIQPLYKLSSAHSLSHIVGQALEKRGLLGEDETSANFQKQVKKAMFRYVSLNHELSQLCAVLENAKIPFVPLKGSVLRNFYPQPWMRTSCDIDILVHEDQLMQAVKAIKEELHYTGDHKGDHDFSLTSPGGILLELHYDTVQKRYANDKRRAVLGKIWEHAAPIREGSFQMVLSDGMFYYYHIAHMAKHFQTGGCGIKPLLDLWILNHKITPDIASRTALLEEGDLLPFARAMEKLSEVWFSGAEKDELSSKVESYILRGGVYGNFANRATLGQAKAGGKLRYLLTRRVFLRYEYLKAQFPNLVKHRWLTPYYQVVRWVWMLKKGFLKRTLHEVKLNVGTDKAGVDETAQMLKELKL